MKLQDEVIIDDGDQEHQDNAEAEADLLFPVELRRCAPDGQQSAVIEADHQRDQ